MRKLCLDLFWQMICQRMNTFYVRIVLSSMFLGEIRSNYLPQNWPLNGICRWQVGLYCYIFICFYFGKYTVPQLYVGIKAEKLHSFFFRKYLSQSKIDVLSFQCICYSYQSILFEVLTKVFESMLLYELILAFAVIFRPPSIVWLARIVYVTHKALTVIHDGQSPLSTCRFRSESVFASMRICENRIGREKLEMREQVLRMNIFHKILFFQRVKACPHTNFSALEKLV